VEANRKISWNKAGNRMLCLFCTLDGILRNCNRMSRDSIQRMDATQKTRLWSLRDFSADTEDSSKSILKVYDDGVLLK
jgi:hypothetical protein